MNTTTHDAEGTLLSQKPVNVLQVPTGAEIIPPGVTQQLIVKPGMTGTLLGIALGPSARAHKLYAGKLQVDVPEDVTAWRPNLPVQAGGFVIITVENTGEEPAEFRALLFIDAPNHQVVVGEPQAPPPLPAMTPPRPVAALGNVRSYVEPRSTAADHGVMPGGNEVAMVFIRNDVTSLLNHLRNNAPLDPNAKNAIVYRLDAALRTQR